MIARRVTVGRRKANAVRKVTCQFLLFCPLRQRTGCVGL